jgi:hypothetical protein
MTRRKTMQSNSRRPAPEGAAQNVLPASRRNDPYDTPVLRFSPTAWAKLLYLRDLGDTEVGGFGISAADDLLFVEDVQLVKQVCTGASVTFDDQAVADFFDRQVDLGRVPCQFGRLWVHTHPGNFAEPSMTDCETFARVFGRTDWAAMFILARGGQCDARLRFHVGPGGDVDLSVEVDYRRPFPASDHIAWQDEYVACVQVAEPSWLSERDPLLLSDPLSPLEPWEEDDWLSGWDNLHAKDERRLFDAMEVEYAI